MNKVLKQDKNEFKIIEITEEEGFLLNSRKNNYEIKIFDEKLIKNIIEDNFQKNYKRILKQIIDEDDNDNNERVLTEIESYMIYIKNKFGKFLTEKELNKYLRMLTMAHQNLERAIEVYKEEKSIKR